ncbi:hypothetical protein LTR37_014722 [Vermiconidia calcicola]|uniref:Uncharacterized protein n=1 Tax=Vermiconidia calcicola TaxID=1690605 RepID=A0ACC3MSS1_9PEZI|nr:hypothetical protein LTR37_014722 [Vermiconidia calcicola]
MGQTASRRLTTMNKKLADVPGFEDLAAATSMDEADAQAWVESVTKYLRTWKKDCIDNLASRNAILEHIGEDRQQWQARAAEIAEACTDGKLIDTDTSDLDPIGRCAQTACQIVLYGDATGDLARATYDSVRRHTWALDLMFCVVADFKANAHGYFVPVLGYPQPRMHAANACMRRDGEKHPQMAKQSALAMYATSNANEAREYSESTTGANVDEVVGSHDLETAKEGVRTTRSKKPKRAALATGSSSKGEAGSIASALGPDAGEYGVRVTGSMMSKATTKPADNNSTGEADEEDEEIDPEVSKPIAGTSRGSKRARAEVKSAPKKRPRRKQSPEPDDIPAHGEIAEQFRRPASYKEPPADTITELRSQLGQLKSRHFAACTDWGRKNDQKHAEVEMWKKRWEVSDARFYHEFEEAVTKNVANSKREVEAEKARADAEKARADAAEYNLETAQAGVALFKTELAMSKEKFSIFNRKPAKGTTSTVNQHGNVALTTEIASLQAQKADLEAQLAAQKTSLEAQLKAQKKKATKEKQHDLATISLLSGIAQRESDKVEAQAYDDEWIGARIYTSPTIKQLEQNFEAERAWTSYRRSHAAQAFGEQKARLNEARKEVQRLKEKCGEASPGPYARSSNFQKGQK